ncbi:MAG TPA: type II toxin-antitoxin system VapC family toxin [Herpetosiphonaceae bacterium]|nr:type II toxin-antitoxin system VapC family toxin [Herpetosiphonaceae bacterium]
MTVIDASVLVSWFHQADAFHHPTRVWLREYLLAGGRLVAPVLLQSEVAGALTRRTSSQAIGARASRWFQALPEIHLFPLDKALGQRAAELAIDLRLRGADAIYVAVAEQLGLPLITWDREQFELGQQRVMTRRPHELSV